MTTATDRRERYAAALYATLETSPARHPWETLSPLRRAVWYARADAAMAIADSEQPPADRAAVLAEAATRYEEILANADTGQDPRYWTAVRDITLGLRRLATEEQPATPDTEETPEDAARRFARRLYAVERLCSGRPGYHTITVKALLTAMSDADDDEAQQ